MVRCKVLTKGKLEKPRRYNTGTANKDINTLKQNSQEYKEKFKKRLKD